MAKSERIAALCVADSGGLDPRYAGWFACFNRGEYFEAHDVLEDLWLGVRGQPIAKFYQGLIQLAGAFVHLRKNRLSPADALFRLAETNLAAYGPRCERLDVEAVLVLITDWRGRLRLGGMATNPWSAAAAPRIETSAD